MGNVETEAGNPAPATEPPHRSNGSPEGGPAAAGTRGADDGSEVISHLYKMSPTAGVATTDYAAINGVAILALILGVGSVLAVAGNLLLVIPVAGLVCGVIALRQIRDSNGTQTGKGLALIGLVLSLGIGGTLIAVQAVRYAQTRSDEREIAAVMASIGDQLRDEKYAAVYDQTSDRFRGRVTKDAFVRKAEAMNQYEQIGRLESIQWNGEPMYVQRNPDTGASTVTAMTFMRFSKLKDPTREVMVFVRQGGHWVVDDFPNMFPVERGPGAGGRGPRGPMVGPQ